MENANESGGNPEIGMTEDSFESAEQTSNEGSETFFNELENSVNSGIQDTEVTQSQISGSEQATHAIEDNGSNNVESQSMNGTDWEKRYADSSREAVKWRDRYKEVESFVPVLDAMKKDSGLVEHVRNYLNDGGAPAKSVQEQLNLDEDFMFDGQEAMTDPDSDSAKVMNAHVDGLVQQRVGEMLNMEKQRANQIYAAQTRKSEEAAFMERNKMTAQQFEDFKAKAKNHKMSLDDVNYLLNRGQAASNVAQSTKQDMLNQMKNVRNMPTSASGVNSQGGKDNDVDRDVFNSILGFDNDVDNLFG
tara:strand:+ start:2197 stop:3108 length:912 start_codon:yes stop_codon:yes gene_type:complete